MGKVYCCYCIYYKGIHDEGMNYDGCYYPGNIISSQEEYMDETPINPRRIRIEKRSGDAEEINANNDCGKFIDKNTRKGKKLRRKVSFYFKYWQVKPPLAE